MTQLEEPIVGLDSVFLVSFFCDEARVLLLDLKELKKPLVDLYQDIVLNLNLTRFK